MHFVLNVAENPTRTSFLDPILLAARIRQAYFKASYDYFWQKSEK